MLINLTVALNCGSQYVLLLLNKAYIIPTYILIFTYHQMPVYNYIGTNFD